MEDILNKNWKTDNVWQFVEQLKSAFKNYVGNNHYVDTFTIQKDPSTVYCLFFFCSHIKAYEKMLEAKWEIDTEEGKGWEYNATPTLFAPIKTNPLEDELKQYLSTGGKTNGEIYEFTLRCGFLPKHANEIFKAHQDNGNLVVNDSSGNKARKGAFYISYPYYKDFRNKVNINFVQ